MLLFAGAMLLTTGMSRSWEKFVENNLDRLLFWFPQTSVQFTLQRYDPLSTGWVKFWAMSRSTEYEVCMMLELNISLQWLIGEWSVTLYENTTLPEVSA